jgi:hypothetical protein
MPRKTAGTHGLEVQEDRAWQEKFWTFQRIGWALMALLILAAMLGATGKGGPLASASAQTPAGTIEYPRITRWRAVEQVTVRLPPATAGKVELELSKAFAELFTIESVDPEPAEVQATGTGHRFSFDVAGGGEKLIVFDVRSAKPALLRTVPTTIDDAPPAEMRVTVLP